VTASPDDGDYTAVLDRFEEGRDGRLAVLVLERDAESVGDLAVDPDRLPADGRETDAVFDVRVRDGQLRSATYRPEASRRRAEDAQSRFDRLSSRPPGGQRGDDTDEDDSVGDREDADADATDRRRRDRSVEETDDERADGRSRDGRGD
jgi:hypothetical protein